MNSLNKTDVTRFLEAVDRGTNALIEAGRLAAEFQRTDPTFLDRVCDSNPMLTPQMVQRFIDIGEGRMHPRWMLSEAAGVRRLRRMSIAIQTTYASKPVELLIKNNGSYEVLQAQVENLTPDQAVQVFSSDHVRDAAEQRTFIEDKAFKQIAPPATSDSVFTIKQHRLWVFERCSFTKSQLQKILRQL